jgi:hypothetical protein
VDQVFITGRIAMLGSTVLEVAIGLTFCYGTLALIVTTLQEALAAAFRLRANTLLAGIKSMLNDPRSTGWRAPVYAHPLVNPHSDGSAPTNARCPPGRPTSNRPISRSPWSTASRRPATTPSSAPRSMRFPTRRCGARCRVV